MREVLTRSTFDFARMKDAPATVYVVIPPEHLEFHKRFVRLVVNLALAAFSKGGRAKVPGLFLIDEVAALGRMDEIAKAYGLLAGYNMIVWCFFQDKGQLDRLYGDDASVMVSSSRAVQVFAIGDEATVGFVVSKLGRSSIKSPSALRGGTEVLPLREAVDVPKEIGRKQFRQYILRDEDAPMILERVEYHRTARWQSLASVDPDYAGQSERWGTGIIRLFRAVWIAWDGYVSPAIGDALESKSLRPLAAIELDDAPSSVRAVAKFMVGVLFIVGGLIALGAGTIALGLLVRIVFSPVGVFALFFVTLVWGLSRFNSWSASFQSWKEQRLEKSDENRQAHIAKQTEKAALRQEANKTVDWEARRTQGSAALIDEASESTETLLLSQSPSALGSALHVEDLNERDRADDAKKQKKRLLLRIWFGVLVGSMVVAALVAAFLSWHPLAAILGWV